MKILVNFPQAIDLPVEIQFGTMNITDHPPEQENLKSIQFQPIQPGNLPQTFRPGYTLKKVLFLLILFQPVELTGRFGMLAKIIVEIGNRLA